MNLKIDLSLSVIRGELERLGSERDKYLALAAHPFRAVSHDSTADSETCRECGCNLRDPLHDGENIEAGRSLRGGA